MEEIIQNDSNTARNKNKVPINLFSTPNFFCFKRELIQRCQNLRNTKNAIELSKLAKMVGINYSDDRMHLDFDISSYGLSSKSTKVKLICNQLEALHILLKEGVVLNKSDFLCFRDQILDFYIADRFRDRVLPGYCLNDIFMELPYRNRDLLFNCLSYTKRFINDEDSFKIIELYRSLANYLEPRYDKDSNFFELFEEALGHDEFSRFFEKNDCLDKKRGRSVEIGNRKPRSFEYITEALIK